MAQNFIRRLDLFHPKTIQDLLISPYCNCYLTGINGTRLYTQGGKWLVNKNTLTQRGFLLTNNEEEAVKMFWSLECE